MYEVTLHLCFLYKQNLIFYIPDLCEGQGSCLVGQSGWVTLTEAQKNKEWTSNTDNFRRQVDISENVKFLSTSFPRCNMPGVSPPFCCLSLILFSNQVMASALVSSASSRTTRGVNEETSLSEKDKPSCIFSWSLCYIDEKRQGA